MSGASGTKRSAMLRRITDLSENDLPVAPGPPLNKVSPEKSTPSAPTWRQHPPGLWPGVRRTRRVVWPQHGVVGVQQDRRIDGLGQGHGHVDVVVVAVGADDGAHPAVADSGGDGFVVMGGVDHHHLLVVADEPDVVVDLEVAAIEREDATGDDAIDPGRHQRAAFWSSTTTERSTSPRSMRWKAYSTSSRAMVSVTDRSRSSRPCR